MAEHQSQAARDRDEHRSRMENRILDSAFALFKEGGLEAITIRNIASAIGYSPGTIYHYFDDKEAIFFRLRDQGLEDLYSLQVAALESAKPAERLHVYARTFLRFAFDQPEYYDLMFLSRVPMHRLRKSADKTAAAETFKLLMDEVQAAMDAGLLRRSPKVRRVALLLFSAMHGLVALAKRERMLVLSKKPMPELLEDTVDLLFDYMFMSAERG